MVLEIMILEFIMGVDVDEFMKKCVNFSEMYKCYVCEGKGDKKMVKVVESRGCDFCVERVREFMGELGWVDKIVVCKCKDYFIFIIEMIG